MLSFFAYAFGTSTPCFETTIVQRKQNWRQLVRYHNPSILDIGVVYWLMLMSIQFEYVSYPLSSWIPPCRNSNCLTIRVPWNYCRVSTNLPHSLIKKQCISIKSEPPLYLKSPHKPAAKIWEHIQIACCFESLDSQIHIELGYKDYSPPQTFQATFPLYLRSSQ